MLEGLPVAESGGASPGMDARFAVNLAIPLPHH
jgi:hypothetical protein